MFIFYILPSIVSTEQHRCPWHTGLRSNGTSQRRKSRNGSSRPLPTWRIRFDDVKVMRSTRVNGKQGREGGLSYVLLAIIYVKTNEIISHNRICMSSTKTSTCERCVFGAFPRPRIHAEHEKTLVSFRARRHALRVQHTRVYTIVANTFTISTTHAEHENTPVLVSFCGCRLFYTTLNGNTCVFASMPFLHHADHENLVGFRGRRLLHILMCGEFTLSVVSFELC